MPSYFLYQCRSVMSCYEPKFRVNIIFEVKLGVNMKDMWQIFQFLLRLWATIQVCDKYLRFSTGKPEVSSNICFLSIFRFIHAWCTFMQFSLRNLLVVMLLLPCKYSKKCAMLNLPQADLSIKHFNHWYANFLELIVYRSFLAVPYFLSTYTTIRYFVLRVRNFLTCGFID